MLRIYGVPQMRKRLVLHGVRRDVYEKLDLGKEDITILPDPTHCKEKKKGFKKWVTVGEAILDLPVLNAGETCDDSIIKNHKARTLLRLIFNAYRKLDFITVIESSFPRT